MDLKWCNLQNELGAYINQMLTDLEQDDENILFTQIWLEVNVMFVFDYYLYGNLEKKVYKRLLEVNKKVRSFTYVMMYTSFTEYISFGCYNVEYRQDKLLSSGLSVFTNLNNKLVYIR